MEVWTFDCAREELNIFLVHSESSIYIELHRSYGLGCPSNLKGDICLKLFFTIIELVFYAVIYLYPVYVL